MTTTEPTTDGRRMRPDYVDLPAGLLPDMLCGDHVAGTTYWGEQTLRPQYISLDTSTTGKPLRLRIWGQRVLDDGTLGHRHLDFVIHVGSELADA